MIKIVSIKNTHESQNIFGDTARVFASARISLDAFTRCGERFPGKLESYGELQDERVLLAMAGIGLLDRLVCQTIGELIETTAPAAAAGWQNCIDTMEMRPVERYVW